jgi:hypothetical protein
VAVPYYSSSGCYGCAAAAGAIVGVTAGAVVAGAATANAYNAGVVAGASSAAVPAVQVPVASYVVGQNYATVPSGCVQPSVQGTTYYLCGNTWFQPMYGANGIYYRVVPTP